MVGLSQPATVRMVDRLVERGLLGRETGRDRRTGALAVAGSGAIVTAFGMARCGYGLLLPDIQDDREVVLAAAALLAPRADVLRGSRHDAGTTTTS